MQKAKLYDVNGNRVATVQVMSFPDNPRYVRWQCRYFGPGKIGYGVDYLEYPEIHVFDVL